MRCIYSQNKRLTFIKFSVDLSQQESTSKVLALPRLRYQGINSGEKPYVCISFATRSRIHNDNDESTKNIVCNIQSIFPLNIDKPALFANIIENSFSS